MLQETKKQLHPPKLNCESYNATILICIYSTLLLIQ